MQLTPTDFMTFCQNADAQGIPIDWKRAAETIFVSANQRIAMADSAEARAAVTEDVLRGLLTKSAAAKADMLIEDALVAHEKAKSSANAQ